MMSSPRILIVKLSAIGDVVHTLPALTALRRHYPRARITWLVEEAAADLVMGHPDVDEVLVSQRKTWLKGLKTPRRRQHLRALAGFVTRLRRHRFDMVLDFQFSLKGAVLIALTRARRKIGFGHGLAHQECSYVALNEHIPAVSMDIHALDRNLIMLQAIGVECGPIEYKLPVADVHRKKAMQLLSGFDRDAGAPFVAINPMAQWESKLWSGKGFARVADRLQQEARWPVVFTGGPGDRAYIDNILGQMKTMAPNLAGRTDLLTLAALLQQAKLMITTDTGPMHIAAAMGTPTVALFGPTAPWRTGPYGRGHQVIQADRPCSPCFKRHCPLSKKCMQTITADRVMSAVGRLATRGEGVAIQAHVE